MRKIAVFVVLSAVTYPVFALEITGTITCHDPSTIIYEGGKYWYFSTANNLYCRSSTDLVTWNSESRPFSFPAGVPQYMVDYLVTCEGGSSWNLWAPDIIKYGDLYYLYYSRNMCYDYNGTERSVCGLAVGSSIAARDWVDQGAVLWTQLNVDYRRSIDPTLLFDPAANLWLAAGSFGHPSGNGYTYGGIWLYQLDKETGMVKAGTNPTQIARAWIEAPLLYYKNGYYYLFFNQQNCCSGTNSRYYIRYGRATSITGPYYDKEGVNLNVQNTGGSLFSGRDYFANYIDGDPPIARPELGSAGREIGPGHMGIFRAENGLEMYSYHFYDANNNGAGTLGLRTLIWGDDGWPRSGWNLADGNYAVVSCMNTEPGAPAGGLYVEASDGEPETPQVWSFNGGTNQVWNFTRTARNQYKITCPASGQVLAVVSPDDNPNNIYGPGKPVKLVTYDSANSAHKWYVVQTNNRGFRMLNSATGMALEIAGSQNSPGARLQVNDWNTAQTNNQRFWLTPAGIYSVQAQFGTLPLAVANTSSGTRLTIAGATGSNLQKWRFMPTYDGYTKIVNVASGLPVDLYDGSFSDNAQIRQYTDLNNNPQKWAFETLTDGSWRILNKSTGKAFTVTGSAAGSYVNQVRWLHTLAQQWSLTLQASSPNTRTWTGGGASGNWSDTNNWDRPAVTDELLVFNGTTGLNNNNNLAVDRQIRGLRFGEEAGSFEISGNRVTLAGDIINDSADAQTLNAAIQLSGGMPRLFAAKAGDIVLNGAVSGNGGIIKSGITTLTLNAQCSYAGDTRIESGVLKIGTADALPASTDLSIMAGAVLDMNGLDMTVNSLDNEGTIIDSTCQGAMLTILNPPGQIAVPGNQMYGLQALAEGWLEVSCSAPDWCTGADRTEDGTVNMEDFKSLSSLWLQCE